MRGIGGQRMGFCGERFTDSQHHVQGVEFAFLVERFNETVPFFKEFLPVLSRMYP